MVILIINYEIYMLLTFSLIQKKLEEVKEEFNSYDLSNVLEK